MASTRPRISENYLVAVRRQRIMGAGSRLVARKGAFSPTVTDIVREARIARNTFYETFRSKDDCLQEVVEWVGLEACRSVTEALAESGARLEVGLSALLSFIARHPAETKSFLLWGPTISPDALAKNRQRLACLLSTSPGPREFFVIGAIEQRLYRFLALDVAAPATELLGELASLVRAIYDRPVGTVHELPVAAGLEKAAA